MNCLRCGNKLDREETFCDDCLREMEKFPVDPDTPVTLPKAKPVVVPRQIRSRSPEETISQQKRTIRRLSIALVVLVLLVALETCLIFLQSNQKTEKPIGQNYSAETTLPQ